MFWGLFVGSTVPPPSYCNFIFFNIVILFLFFLFKWEKVSNKQKMGGQAKQYFQNNQKMMRKQPTNKVTAGPKSHNI